MTRTWSVCTISDGIGTLNGFHVGRVDCMLDCRLDGRLQAARVSQSNRSGEAALR